MSKKLKRISVIPYNSEWPEQFGAERARIAAVLGNCAIIHHVGSTAVPGLAAKPKIDIIVEINNPADAVQLLESIGYEYMGEYNIPLHYGFRKRGYIDVNLHVYPLGHPEIELNLLFRDYLRSHPDARDEYGKLKQRILTDPAALQRTTANHSRFAEYTLRKGPFIRNVLRAAGFERPRMVRASDAEEWTTVRQFRHRYFFGPQDIQDPYEWTFTHKDHHHFLLYCGVGICGYAHVQLWPEKRAIIRQIVIDESMRNQGFGTVLMQFIEQWLVCQEYIILCVDARPTSVGFYEKCGFMPAQFSDPEGHEHDPQDIQMQKPLAIYETP